MNSPLARGSRAITAVGRLPLSTCRWPKTTAAACATCSASSAVINPLARPRTPSVPNNLDIANHFTAGFGRDVSQRVGGHTDRCLNGREAPQQMLRGLAVEAQTSEAV